jgi:hypothetical protein
MTDMPDYVSLPPELLTVLNGESQDFKVKAQKAYPAQTSMTTIFFGLFWTGFISIFWLAFLGPVFLGHEVHFKTNGVATTAGPGHLGPLLIPAIMIFFFTIIGILILGSGFKMLSAPGPWFVGTPTRLIVWSPNSLRTMNWEQFDGSLNVDGNSSNGTITVEMRSGNMVSSNNGPSRYVPEKIYIVGIPNAILIEEMCRKRINEHGSAS